MKRREHVVETIAQMARYNPFFGKAGFVYMWETTSGRPVFMYPLTTKAKKFIDEFLKKDEEARKHQGKLYRSRYGEVEPLKSPIELVNLSKMYSSELDISRLPTELQDVLRAFGVERRIVERYVLKDVNLTIEPRDIVVVVGAPGAGKTTLLRMIIGSALNIEDERHRPSSGMVKVPENVKLEYMLPGEHEPLFSDEHY